MGSNPPEEIQGLSSEHVVIEGYVSDETLKRMYEECRVCIIPLRYGAGVKGKTIEALYHKIPIVTTSVGIEGLPGIQEIIQPVDMADMFAKEVIRCYCEDNLEKIRAGYRFVKEHYSRTAAEEFFTKYFGEEYRRKS